MSHRSVQLSALKFLQDLHLLKNLNVRIAELGSLDINGSIKNLTDGIVGFDIVEGPGVDVVIEIRDGKAIVPLNYRNIFDCVLSISSFQTCPDPELYMSEILQLLKLQDSHLFLTMCSNSCNYQHSTSENIHNFLDGTRYSRRDLKFFLLKYFNNVSVKIKKTSGFNLHFEYVVRANQVLVNPIAQYR